MNVELLELLRSALEDHRRRSHATTSNLSEDGEVVDDLVDTVVPLLFLRLRRLSTEESGFVGVESSSNHESRKRSGRDRSDEDGERERHGTDDDGDSPISSADRNDLESLSSELDDEELTSDHCACTNISCCAKE